MRTATTVMLAAAATTGQAGPNCSRARRAYVNVTATGVTHYRDTELLPWLDGMPGPAYHGALLGRHGGNVRAAVDAHAQPVLRFVARGQSLLDVGCGFCWLGKLLRERRPDVRYAGATVSREQVAHCRALGFEVHAIDFTDAAAVHRALGARRFDAAVLDTCRDTIPFLVSFSAIVGVDQIGTYQLGPSLSISRPNTAVVLAMHERLTDIVFAVQWCLACRVVIRLTSFHFI